MKAKHFSRWPQLIAEADKLFELALPFVKTRVEGKTQAGADEVQNVIAELLEENAKQAMSSSITLCSRDDTEQPYYYSVPEVKAKAFYEQVIEKKQELDQPVLVLIFLAVLYMPQKPSEYPEALTFNIKLMCYQLQQQIPAKQQQDGFFKPSAASKFEAILLITTDFMRQDKHEKALGY